MHLNGIHHVTAVSSKISTNYDFYTRVMGLRLVKRTVNQDDTSAYHLFYADKLGSPGTDMTFFDWTLPPEQRGTDSIARTAFRVNGEDALAYWQDRLEAEGVSHNGVETVDGRQMLRFEDPEGQRLMLIDDAGAPYHGEVWDGNDIPAEHALRGFYAVVLSVRKLESIAPILTQVLNFQQTARVTLPDGADTVIYDIGEGGPGRELWVRVEPDVPNSRPGAGSVHHAAFRVKDEAAQKQWRQRIAGMGVPISQVIDRFYFKSIYFRISGGILFEIATDGPGFATDEDADKLGEELALPPFLEPRRESIEAGLDPIEA